MQSSIGAVQHIVTSAGAVTGNVTDSACIDGFSYMAASNSAAASAMLQPRIDAVWPDTDNGLSRIRHAVATWLAGCPSPALGPYHALLTSVGHFLRVQPALSSLLLNPATPLPKLKMFLLSPESRGIFIVATLDGREVVMLDELALRRVVTTPRDVSNDRLPTFLPSSLWDSGVGSHIHHDILPMTTSGDSSIALKSAASTVINSNIAYSNGPLFRALSAGAEVGETVDSMQLGALAQPIVAAIAAAWPGGNALARLKRRAALALAAAQDGPEGPYSMLASALGDVLHRHEPEAVSELRHPVTKTLRVKQLLHEGGPSESASSGLGPSSAVSLTPSPASFGSLSASVVGQPGGNTANMLGSDGPGFLRVVKGKYDIVVVLDLPGLLQAHGISLGLCSPLKPSITPPPTMAAMSSGTTAGPPTAPTPPPLQPNNQPTSFSSHGGASTTSSGSTAPAILAHVHGLPPLGRTVSDATALATDLGGANGSQSATGMMGGPHGPLQRSASSSEASSALPYGIEGAAELALRAFPGSAPGAQLRRSIVLHLAGLPRRSQLWTHLGIFVANSQAHLWLNPGHRWPKLKAFVLHPDSRGVFLDVQMPGPGAAAGLVALDPAALRRAAAAGLATAIAAAWPGHAPLERIRRAAAFTLAFAVRGPAGPYTMLGSALGTAIRKRDKEAFDALAGMGKLSELLDDTSACCTSSAAATATSETIAATSGGGGGTTSGGGAPTGGGSNSSGGGAAGNGSGGGAAGPQVGISPNGSTAGGESSSSGGALTGGAREGSGGGATSGGGAAAGSSSGGAGSGGGGSGGGGSSGGAGSGGYIVSFKKDQDGYMRLRLEALLQDHPREDPPMSDRSTACSSTCNSGRLIFPMDTPGSNNGGGTESGGASGGGAGDLLSYSMPAAAFVLQGSAASLLQGGFIPGAAGLQAQQVSVTPGSSGILHQPSGVLGSQCTTAVTSSAAGNADVGSPPLEQELMRRFPAPPGAAPGSEAATIAAAKRCIARLLAWAPPPHQLTFAKLGAQVPKLLGGARIGRNLRLVCLEEPEVFMVQSQSPTVHVVRLVCPRLLQLAHEQSERRSQAGLTHLSPAQSQPQPPQLHPAAQHPLAHLAAQQQPQSQPPQPQQPQHLLHLGHSQHLQHQQQQQVLQVVIGGNPAVAAAAAAAAGGPHHHAVHSLLQLPSQTHHQHFATGAQLHPAQSAALTQPGLTLGATSAVNSAGAVSQVSLAQAAPGRGRLFLGSHPLALQPQPTQALQQCHPVAAAAAAAAATGVRVGGLGAHGNGGSHLLQQQQGLQQSFQQQQQHRLILTGGGSQGTQGAAGIAGFGADAGDMQAHAATAQQQQGLQVSTSQVGGSTAGGVDSSGRGGTGTGAAAPANGGWSTAAAAASWQLQSAQELPSHLSTSQQQQLLLLQHHHHHQQQQQQAMPQQLRTQQSLGSASVTSGGSGVVQSRLYDERLPLTPSGSLQGTVPGLSTANVDATSMAPSSVDGGGAYSARTLEPASSQPPGSWHNGNNGIGIDSGALSQQHPHSQSQAQLTQQPPQLAATLAGTSTGSSCAGGANGPPRLQGLQDFAAAALVAEQALQQSSGAAGVGLLPPTAVHVLSDPYSPDFFAVMQHCLACAQVGLAVQVYDGRPALVALFAPSAVAVAVPSGAAGAELASVAVSRGGALPETTWPPAVYVLDTTAAAAGEGPEAVVSTLLASLRGLLEEPGVAKVVHGCEQVRPLEVAAGASIAPLLDTRVLLDAISSMLPPLPPPPSVAAVAAAAAAGALPPGGYGSAEAAAMAQLAAHVGGLRAVLQSVELWADRPELVRVLTTLHFAAHRSELWAAAGRDSTWLSRPLTESQVAVAAQSVHHLPDLWAALCEAVPWLAAHAALRLMQHLRSVPLTMAPHLPRGRGQS